jgi:hypothetical protein
MPTLVGSIGPWGPIIDVKVMQSNQRVAALKKAGRPFSSPYIVRGLIDTGASISALDVDVIRALGLDPRGRYFYPHAVERRELREAYDL